MKAWQIIVLLILTGVFSFGGTFVCRSSDDDDHSSVAVDTP